MCESPETNDDGGGGRKWGNKRGREVEKERK